MVVYIAYKSYIWTVDFPSLFSLLITFLMRTAAKRDNPIFVNRKNWDSPLKKEPATAKKIEVFC
jgi:hypothetical protein